MSNRVNLKLDVTKASIKNPLITVRQGDGEFETLRATVTANGEALDLQGFTITFMGTTAGKHKIVDGNVTIVEASNGVFEYTPSKAWGMDVGGFKIAYFKFVSGDGSTSSANFQVEVIESVDLTQEEAQNYISVVDATISEIDKRLNDSLATVTQSIAETSSAASSLAVNVSSVASSAVNQINETASSAAYNVNGVASNAVNNVNSTASSAVDNVNNTASSAVNNVNITASNAKNSITSSVTSLGNRVDDYNNKLVAVQVGGRNYLLNSSYKLLGSADLYTSYTNFSSSVPISKFSNSVITLSAQFDYDSITALSNQKRLGFEVSAKQVFSDGTTKSIVFNIWVNPVLGSSFHGRKSATYNLTDKSIAAISNSSPNSWVGGLYIQSVFGTNVSVSNPKIEIGNIATDWSPAPEDAPSNDAQLVHKTGTETIAGDKAFTGTTTLSTTTILAGNYGLRVTASGIQKTTDGKTWVSANI